MAETLFTPLCVRMLEDGHAVRFQAPGSSMHPAIRDGEWVTVEPTRPAFVRRGDVLLYHSVRGLTAHRVVRVVTEEGTRARFVFRGDNTGALDEPVAFGHILGRVACVERGGEQIDPNSIGAGLSVRASRGLHRLKRPLAALAVRTARTLLRGLRWCLIAR